jgi:hypothetical protein
MINKKKMELTEGSEYKITSLGGKDSVLETEGIFRGFISIGVDESGLLMELSKNHGNRAGEVRIVPLHVILLIDILNAKEDKEKDDDKGVSHYVG